MLDYLEEAGEAESPVVCPFREHGLQINAYVPVHEGQEHRGSGPERKSLSLPEESRI